MSWTLRRITSGIIAAVVVISSATPAQGQGDAPKRLTGTLPSSAEYIIDVPANWNGKLLLYGHGYGAKTAMVAPNETIRSTLLDRGFALAGSSYSRAGFAIDTGPSDQLGTLEAFKNRVGEPNRTIAWGTSMGGAITSLLAEQSGTSIDATVLMCPAVSSAIGWFNAFLDSWYTMAILLAPDNAPDLVNIKNPAATQAAWTKIINDAQQTTEGRARLALAAVLGGLPNWTDPTDPEPDTNDYEAQQQQQHKALLEAVALVDLARADFENHAGGPFSWNTDIDYSRLLPSQDGQRQVKALYRAADLDLDSDLNKLNAGKRISATDPAAIKYLDSLAPTGEVKVPSLTVHTTDDPAALVWLEHAYWQSVVDSKATSMVRQRYVHRAGHCTFTDAEQVSALLAMDKRLDDGKWSGMDPDDLNKQANSLNLGGSDFAKFKPPRPPRG